MDALFSCIQVNTFFFAVAQGPAQAVELWRRKKRLEEKSKQCLRPTKRYTSRKGKVIWFLSTDKKVDNSVQPNQYI